MTTESNASQPEPVTARAAPLPLAGVLFGLLGVVGFSFSFPATKLAVTELDPWFVAFGRAAVAAALAVVVLSVGRAPWPTRAQWRRLGIVAFGVVVGFPLFSGLALVTSDSAHGAVVIALLPAATALCAVARAGERPGVGFWLAAGSGLAIVLAFVLVESGGGFTSADLLLLVATAVCALGYAEGGALSRELGGARTICWALVLAAPITLPITVGVALGTGVEGSGDAWFGFGYVALVSMFLGFFAWYAGLARGGVAKVGQIQLLQPLLTLAWSALVLGESFGAWTVVAAVGVLASVVATQRARVDHLAPSPATIHTGGGLPATATGTAASGPRR